MWEVNLEDVVVGWPLPRRSFLKFCPSNWTSTGWQSRSSPISKPGSPTIERRNHYLVFTDKKRLKVIDQ